MPSVRAVVALSMLVFCVMESFAQKERVLPRRGSSSLEGTSFVVGFMQNEIDESGGESALSLFLSSEYPATVVLDFPDGQRVIETLVQHSVRIVPLSAYFSVDVSERRERKAILVSSNYPITVHAMNAKDKTTDTYAAIPIAHLGKNYYSVNRPNDNYRPSGGDIAIDTLPRGGEFMVLATEANTTVVITPACATAGGNQRGIPFTVTLQPGHCYLVRSAPGRLGTNDLTGSRIVSSKPVALLSGHVRASVPTYDNSSKDHLVEMLPSVNQYGKEFATAPFAISEVGDYFRIVTSADSTQIQIVDAFGTQTIRLNSAGDWTSVRLRGPAYWKCSRPCLLVQFMASSSNQYSDTLSRSDYDPAMVVVPSMSQFVLGALFQFPVLTAQNVSNQPRHYYVNLIADSVAIPSLAINGIPLTTLAPGVNGRIVPGTSLRWSQVRLTQGVVAIACDTGTFSGVMYGCSTADSYANLFGIRFDSLPKLDLSPPVYDLAVDCGRVSGTVTDVSAETAEIDDVIIQAPPTRNYSFSVTGPLDSIGTMQIDASVRDMWSDALIAIHTYDKKGNGKEWLYTYDAPRVRLPQNLAISLQGLAQVCVDAWIVNIDTTSVRIASVMLQADPRYVLVSTLPKDTMIASGDSVSVRICYTPSTDTVQRTARLQVYLPCGLRKDFFVRTQSVLSIKTKSIDFGPVRVGDTACGHVAIINDGLSPLIITALTMAQSFPQFTPDTSLLALPRDLLAGDTLWVDVCFVPDSVGAFTREDSVQSEPDLDAIVGYEGRGIRPDVADVVINWGKRRIGTRSDSTFMLSNTGEASCLLDRLSASGDSVFFDVGTLGVPSIAVPGNGNTTASVAFTPTTVGLYSASMPLLVDWRLHDTVRIRFVGEGIVPAVETFDVDMGAVLIGNRRDSISNLVRSYGTERLTITRVTLQGADRGAFVIPASLLNLQGLATPSMFAGLVSFTPQRAGYHAVTVAVEHDAMPGFEKDTSFVTIHGVGIVPDTVGFTAVLIVNAVLDACVDTSATIQIENTGNTDIAVYDIELYNGSSLIYADTTTPFVLRGHTVRDVVVPFTPDRNWNGTLRSVVRHGNNQTDTNNVNFSLRIPSVEVTATPVISVFPGASIDIVTHVRGESVHDVAVSLTGEFFLPFDRLIMNTDRALVATVDDAFGLGRKLPVLVTRANAGVYRWVLDGPVQSPFHATWTVSANSLWKDPKAFDVQTTVGSTICADGGSALTTVTSELCAGALRVVRFAAVPSVAMRVTPNPVEQEFNIEIIASDHAEISLHLMTTTGERFVLAEKILLIKGTQHVKFSRSHWASGLYLLVLQHGNAAAGLPVMLVN